jgi:phosphatidylserine/phosphatidylglycerophosphate/cardiolipin synthase-like enzyme
MASTVLALLLACATQQVWFSSQDDVTSVLNSEMASASDTLDVAVYTFTSEELAASMVDAQTQRGVAVRVVIDHWEANDVIAGQLAADGIPVRRLGGYEADPASPGSSKMHHKFTVVDGTSVLTGSFNYTLSADHSNHENLLLLVDPAMAARFTEEFEVMWARAIPQEEWSSAR